VAEVKDGELREFEFRPEDIGLVRTGLDGLEVTTVADSLELIQAALSGAGGDRAQRARQIVALNAGAALYVAGITDSIEKGVLLASEKLASGAASEKLQQLVSMTQGF